MRVYGNFGMSEWLGRKGGFSSSPNIVT